MIRFSFSSHFSITFQNKVSQQVLKVKDSPCMSNKKTLSCSFSSIAVTHWQSHDSAAFPHHLIYLYSTKGPSMTSQPCGFQAFFIFSFKGFSCDAYSKSTRLIVQNPYILATETECCTFTTWQSWWFIGKGKSIIFNSFK